MIDSRFQARIRELSNPNPELQALINIADNVDRARMHEDTMKLRGQVQKYASKGFVGLYVWQRDCDHASWDTITILPAEWFTVYKEITSVYDNAEGPVSWRLVVPESKGSFKSTHRDHIMEAFENGHPHCVAV